MEHIFFATSFIFLSVLNFALGGFRHKEKKEAFVGVRAVSESAQAYYDKGDFNKAHKLYKKAFEINNGAYGQINPDVAVDLKNIGKCLAALGDYTKAVKCYQQALEIDKRFYGDYHPKIAEGMESIAEIYYHRCNCPEAVNCYEKTLVKYKEVYNGNVPEVVGGIKDRIARCNSLGMLVAQR